jgi:hypothetical protein
MHDLWQFLWSSWNSGGILCLCVSPMVPWISYVSIPYMCKRKCVGKLSIICGAIVWASSLLTILIQHINTKLIDPQLGQQVFFLDLISNILIICRFNFCVVQYLFVISLRTFGPLTICDSWCKGKFKKLGFYSMLKRWWEWNVCYSSKEVIIKEDNYLGWMFTVQLTSWNFIWIQLDVNWIPISYSRLTMEKNAMWVALSFMYIV